MKTKVILFEGILILVISLSAQQIVKNSDKPASPRAGRILSLREEVRISDKGGEFFLQYPRILKTGPDGFIYIYDRDQLVQLESQGRFLRNLYKKGQGPGELNLISSFECVDGLLLVHSNNPGKLVWFDAQGKAIREVSLAEAGRMNFLFHAGENSYFFKQGTLNPSGKAVPIDVPHLLLTVSDDGREKRELTAFPLRTLIVQGAMLWDRIQAVVLDRRFVFVSHSNPYSIKLFDCQAQRLLRTFSRPYKRVSRPKDRGVTSITTSDGRKFELPGSEFLDDISEMFIHKETLWVQTSTKNLDKGYLFDVFNLEGRYVDMFYLKTGGRLLAVEGDALFIVERTPDETIEIAKYRIVD
jgi:hypothetical protein